MAQPDGLRLWIHESTEAICAAKGIHRSGSRLRPISVGDLVLSSDESVPCGKVSAVEVERIDRENWVYRVEYRPITGTLHPIDSWVVWREIKASPIVPAPVVQRMVQPTLQSIAEPNEIPVAEIVKPANGKKHRKTIGQRDNGVLASAPPVTA